MFHEQGRSVRPVMTQVSGQVPVAVVAGSSNDAFMMRSGGNG